MIGGLLARGIRRRRGPPVPPEPPGVVTDLARVRIERALLTRERYKYVRPRVERESPGWAIFSPNCSRNVDPQGGEIAIAWLVPANEGLWLLHARDHARGCWRLEAAGLPLDEALRQLCEDPQRRYWP
jgi:hypothetical protein